MRTKLLVMRLFMLMVLSMALLPDVLATADTIDSHTVVLDGSGKIIPWTTDPSLGYDQVMNLAWNYLLTGVPSDSQNGKPYYYSYSCMLPDTQQAAIWPHNPAGLYSMLTESALKYYGYSGNIAPVNLARDVATAMLTNGMTQPGSDWVNVPYASGDAGSLTYQGAAFGNITGQGDGTGVIEPDKVGEMGYAWLQLYRFDGNTSFRDAAIAAADALASHVRIGNASQSPWPFRVFAKTGVVREEYCADVIGPIRLFDGLISLGLGNTAVYQTARQTAWDWMMAYPMRNNVWANYFEDVAIQPDTGNITQYNALMTARYLLEHPEFDPSWESHVRGLISWVENIFAITSYGANTISIAEQIQYLYPMGSHTSRYASVNALLSEATGDAAAREKAYRSLNWATYMARDNGIVIDGPDVPSVNHVWFTDGYGDYIRHFMTSMGAVPDWAPAGQNHLVRSSSVVKSISYVANAVNYTTSDGASTEDLRMFFPPAGVTVDGQALSQRSDLSQAGWTFDPSLNVLRIRHDAGTNVQIVSETLSSIAVTPVNQSTQMGTTQQFIAIGTYSGGSTQNLSSQTTWTSSNTSVATINSTGLATAGGVGSSTISATLNGVTGSTTLTVQANPLTITTASLPGGAMNVSYSATLVASGGTTPYSWSIVVGSLPAGLSLNSSTGVVSGTPTAVGTFSFTVQASDAGTPQQIAIRALSITIAAQANFSIWPSALPVIADSGPDSAVELGVKFRSDSNGSVTGIRFYKATANSGTHIGNLWSSSGRRLATATFIGETASGWQQVSFSAPVAITANTVYIASYHTNTGHYSCDQYYFATTGVNNAPLHTPADGVSGANGVYAYGSNSSFPSLGWRSSNYWVDVVVSAVVPPPVTLSSIVVTPANQTIQTGTTRQFTATGTYSDGSTQNISSQATWTSSDTSVATINSTGLATARAAGSTTISAALNGINGSTSLAVQVVPLTITTASLPGGTLNVSYSATLAAGGGTAPYSWSIVVGSLPAGLSLNSSTGVVSGTPTAGGTSNFTVQVSDTGTPQQIATKALSITVTVPIILSSIALSPVNPSIQTGTTRQFTATGTYSDGSTQNITSQTTWTSSNSNVATITSAGLATARAVGSSTISASLSGITGSTTLTVQAPPLTITTASLPGGTLNVSYSATLAAGGGTNPYNWSIVVGSLPAGLSLNSSTGVVSGTPTAGGTFSFTVQVSDTGTPQQIAASALTIMINTQPTPTAPILDVSVTTKQSTAASSISSPSFSTSRPNELLIAFIASDGPGAASSQSFSTVTGGGLNWTLRARANTQAGTAEIWQARSTTLVTNAVITATRANGKYQGMMTVAVFQGASMVSNGAAGSAGARSGTPTVSLTTTRSNSLIWGVGSDWDQAITRTVNANQTEFAEFLAPSKDTFWVQYVTSPTIGSGVTATISCTAPTNDRWNLAAIEIVAQ